jgi:hypothetical protein
MRYGSLPRSVARSLANCPIERNYAPDGLTEQAINALLDELCLVEQPADAATHRSERRRVREIVRTLPNTLATHPSQAEGEAA